MPKLNAQCRATAIKMLREGATNQEISAKYGVSSSAAAYLKKVATGTTPQLTKFIESLGAYCPERILRLAKNYGVLPKELAEDYETTTPIMKSYLEKVWPSASRPKPVRINLKKRRR
jgi:hypothetical protein